MLLYSCIDSLHGISFLHCYLISTYMNGITTYIYHTLVIYISFFYYHKTLIINFIGGLLKISVSHYRTNSWQSLDSDLAVSCFSCFYFLGSMIFTPSLDFMCFCLFVFLFGIMWKNLQNSI